MSVLVPLLLLAAAAPVSALEALPVGTNVDYQLGGNALGAGRRRDRRTRPPGCSGSRPLQRLLRQRLPDPARRERLLATPDRAGAAQARRPVVDGAWGEWLLDIRTDEAAGRAGPDHGLVDTRLCRSRLRRRRVRQPRLLHPRSGRMITRGQAIAFARRLVRVAHASGLAVGQKNLADFDGRTGRATTSRSPRSAVATASARRLRAPLRAAGARDRVPPRRLPLDLRPPRRPAAGRAARPALSPRGVRAWC